MYPYTVFITYSYTHSHTHTHTPTLITVGVTSGELAKDKNGKTTIEAAVDSDIAKNSVRLSAASNASKNSKTSKESKSGKADGNNETSNNYYASNEAPKVPIKMTIIIIYMTLN